MSVSGRVSCGTLSPSPRPSAQLRTGAGAHSHREKSSREPATPSLRKTARTAYGSRPPPGRQLLFRAYFLKTLFGASREARFFVAALSSLVISPLSSATPSVSSSTDKSERSCPMSWLIFLRGRSSSSIAILVPPAFASQAAEAVASLHRAG